MHRFNHPLRALAAGALTLTMTLSASAAGLPYADVSADAWYAGYITYCQSRGMIDGVSGDAFAPEQPMTRAVLAEALYRLAGSPPAIAEEGEELVLPFADVPEDSPCADAILWAWQKGVMSGYGAAFGPEDPITREQIAAIFWQAQGQPEVSEPTLYADQEQISSWAVTPVAWANELGLMTGKAGNCFDPAGTTTRAEGTVILKAYDRTFLRPVLPEPEPVPANTYDSALFVPDENGFLTYQGDAPSHIGVDVSSHQQTVDWAQVAGAGVEFAMIRAGYRGYYNPVIKQDTCYDYNMKNALDNGLEVGVYFFSQAINVQEAREEAYQLLEWMEGYDITYPVVFDWEEQFASGSRTKGLDGETVAACALAFCEVIREAGYIPMTYGSPLKVNEGQLDLSYLQDYPFWLAHYTKEQQPTTFPYHFQMWQYSSTGVVPGIEGRVDLNLSLSDWAEW